MFESKRTAHPVDLGAMPELGASPGTVLPGQAWALLAQGLAVLVDVRTIEERKLIGFVPRSVHIPWAIGLAMVRNPDFIAALEARVARDQVLLLICRSGKRSALAAQAAAEAGFRHVYNVLEGFEGDLDEESHRSSFEGWRYRGLPWVQE